MILSIKNSLYIIKDIAYEDRRIPQIAGFNWDTPNRRWFTRQWDVAYKLIDYADLYAAGNLSIIKNDQSEKVRLSRSTAGKGLRVSAPGGLAYRPFQLAAVEYALQRKNTLIGDEMGLGKTIEAIGFMNVKPQLENILIVCPASLKINWQRELKKWLVTPKVSGICEGRKVFPQTPIVIINYDILKKFKSEIDAVSWDLLVCDESHYLSNPETQRTTSIFGHKGTELQERIEPVYAEYKLFLSGTPILNRPVELWPLLHALLPDIFSSYWNYAIKFCGGHQTDYGMDVKGATNKEELQEILRSTIMLRRLKKDVLDSLPAKRRQIICLPQTGVTKLLNKQDTIWKTLPEDSYIQDAENLESCKDSIAFEEMSEVRHEIGLAKVGVSIQYILDMLKSVQKIVVFAYHQDVIDLLKEGIEKKGHRVVILTGSTSQVDRQKAVDAFQNEGDVRVFIGNIKAAGVGLTLTAASHVVFIESDWVLAWISQAEDRCHRIGQTNSVLVQHLVFDKSLDCRMTQRVIEKQEVIERVLN